MQKILYWINFDILYKTVTASFYRIQKVGQLFPDKLVLNAGTY